MGRPYFLALWCTCLVVMACDGEEVRIRFVILTSDSSFLKNTLDHNRIKNIKILLNIKYVATYMKLQIWVPI